MQKVATIAILLLAIALVPVPVTAVYSSSTETEDTSNTNTDTENSESESEQKSEPESTETEPTTEPITEPPTTTEPVIPEVLVPEPEPQPPIECPEGYILNNNNDCEPTPLTELGELVGPPSEDCAIDATALECLEEILDENLAPLEENGTSPLPSPSPDVEVEVNVTEPDDGNNNNDDNQTNGNGGNQTNGDDDDNEKDDDRKKRHDHFKRIVKNIDIHKTVINQNEFPDVDIIGLSIKDNGEAMICIMEIDGDNVQCQEFGVPNDRINENVWRIIETDKDDNFDDGNTGSDDVDDAIDAIKAYDFSELKDIDNHEFDVDLAALGINPQGEGLVCLLEDDRDEGTALCEPFKVSNQAISGQITEITEMNGD